MKSALARGRLAATLTLACLALARPATAQPSVYNLVQARSGNLPYQSPANRYDLYDQLNLDYGFKDVRLGLRYETNRASDLRNQYAEVTQKYAEVSTDHSRLRVGNFYTILGRGLLHRSFEVPGVILDQAGGLAAYSQSRDMEGVLGELDAGPVSGRAFTGAYNGGEYSPAAESQGVTLHEGHTSAGQLVARIHPGAQLGAAYLRYSGDGTRQDELGTGFAAVDPLQWLNVKGASLPVYFEYAQQNQKLSDWWKFRTARDVPHALYAGLDFLAGPVSVSAEWKDYSQFRLGTNDPPSLVKEHSAPLLNRATHVLDAQTEKGYQLEASVNASAWLTLTGNLSRADGRQGPNGRRFVERYLEAHVAPAAGNAWEATGFVASGKDAFDGVEDRNLQGASGTVRLPRGFSMGADVERQGLERRELGSFNDVYISGSVARAGWGSAALTWQHTTDPIDLGPPDEHGVAETAHNFVSATLAAQFGTHHDATLTLGERRGGLTCTAGTCYQVVPFKGAVLRVSSRF